MSENTKAENIVVEKTEPKKKHPHIAHRNRLRKRYRKVTMNGLELHEFIELILFYAIPRKNTNEIAHALEDKFETFANILEANETSLKEIDGISDSTALYFKILLDSVKYYNLDKAKESTESKNKSHYENYLLEYYKTETTEEKVLLITLNAKMDMISEDIICVGNINSTKVDINKMMKTALVKNASGVILAHNHPNGIVAPSPDDMETTKKIINVFTEVNINFIDHYVVAGNQIASIQDKIVKSYFD